MTNQDKLRVWDLGVRIFHWSLVVLFAVSYISGDEENLVHIYAGYGVLALLALRIIWGFIGTKYARFHDFIYGPATTLNYAKSLLSSKPIHYTGHNPLGGWMVIALLVLLLGVSISGLKVYGSEGHGPLAQQGIAVISPAMAHKGGDDYEDDDDDDDDDEEEREHEDEGHELWEEIHEILSDFTLILICLHIIGAVAASLIHRENLIRAMVTGYKSPPE